MTQLELITKDVSYIRQIQLVAKMVEDGRLKPKDYKIFVQRLAQTLKHKQLSNN